MPQVARSIRLNVVKSPQFVTSAHDLLSLKQLGFNLIELMVTIAVLAIVLSVAAPNYTRFIASTQVRSVAESIRNGLQLARAEAVKRNQDVTFTLNNDTSWGVRCATCAEDIQSKTANEGASGAVTLTLTGGNTLRFGSLGQGTGMTQVDVSNTSAGATTLSVRINANGSTKVCDPAITSTTDPRAC